MVFNATYNNISVTSWGVSFIGGGKQITRSSLCWEWHCKRVTTGLLRVWPLVGVALQEGDYRSVKRDGLT